MSAPRKSSGTGRGRKATPKTPEEMETYLIGLAYERTEKQIMDGTVSPTTLNYFLRLGGTRAELELEKIKNENKLLDAKSQALESEVHVGELFDKAIAMFGVYTGETNLSDVELGDGYDED